MHLRLGTAVVITGLLAALFVLATFSTMAWQRHTDLLHDRQLNNERLASTLAEHAGGMLRQSELLLAMVSERLDREGGRLVDGRQLTDFVVKVMDKAPLVGAVRVVAPGGGYLFSYPDKIPDGVTVGDRDYIRAQLAGHDGIYIGKPIVSRVNGRLVLPVSRAHRAADGKVVAVLALMIHLDQLQALFDSVRQKPNGTVGLFGRNGILLARAPMDPALMGKDFSQGPLFREHLARSPEGSYTSVVATDQQMRQASYRTVDGFPVVVSVSNLYEDTLGVWYSYLQVLGAIGVPLILAIAAITWLLHRQVAEREKAERLLARRTADLELANEELRHVAEISAHHLQEPLRTVLSYAQLLVRKAKGEAGGDFDEYLGFIAGGVERMKGQLNALQRYLGVEQCRAHEDVSLSRMLADALTGLHAQLTQAGAVIKAPRLPHVRGDRQQLASLFHHLVSAILGRRRPDCRQTIDIDIQREEEGWHLSITADNTDIDFGEGETSFPVLDAGSGSAGAGGPTLSLALCRKITHLHGGRMWAETTEEGQTRLHVILPAG